MSNELTRPYLLVTNDLGPHVGGIEAFILGLLDYIPGEKLIIYTSREDESAPFDAALSEKYGLLIYRDPRRTLLPTPATTRRILQIIKKHQSRSLWYGAAAPLALMTPALKRGGIKDAIALTHGHEVWWAKLPIFRNLMRRIGNHVETITYLGSFTRNAIAPALGKRPNLVQIAPGINLQHFSPGVKRPDLIAELGVGEGPVIISVGRLVKRKGQDRLIAAMPTILRAIPNAKLLIVGRGKDSDRLHKITQRYGLVDVVKFVGRVNYSELPDYFRLGDLFVMPSRSRLFGLIVEGLGIVYLEASACGLPVIAGDSGGAPDAVENEITGLVVDGRSQDAIARAALSILQSPDGGRSMGQAGREWVLAEWSWQRWGTRFAELFTHEL